ncbi:MBL fold metallo-hydrolase [Candidatus Falkowbacteria bacterium]|nr:MBL fold metallo-hydrolase [Candidatus Falkowbacteria bacterium]
MPKKQNLATVKILVRGYFKWLNEEHNQFKASSTVTLIKDGPVNILVDTGNYEIEKKLLSALKKEGLKTSDINYVIITHHHADHVANKHLFKNAIFTDWLTSYKNNKFVVDFDIVAKGKNVISPNVYLIPTPGHSDDACTVIVNTAKGIVAIAGDLFVSKQVEKNIYVTNKKEYQKSAKKILALADYIIPGHGDLFKVKK